MIVAFLDLLGFSQLLALSTEVALDNVNVFNNVIWTKVKDAKVHPLEEYKEKYPEDEGFHRRVEAGMVSSFDYMISFSDSLILGSNSINLFVVQL